MQLSYIKSRYLAHIFYLMALGLILNILTLKSPVLGFILSVFWLSGLILKLKLARRGLGLAQSMIVLIAGLIILGSSFFYLFNLGTISILLIIVILTFLIFGINKKNQPIEVKTRNKISLSRHQLISLVLYCIFYCLTLIILFQHQSVEPIRTPWEVLPKVFFVIYFLLSGWLILFMLAKPKETEKNNYPTVQIILITLHYFLTLSVALIIYKIGFGFDPFVHRAAEKALAQLGYINPKPFYYIGQYSMVVLLARFLSSSISVVDKLFVPVLASVILPGLIYAELKKIWDNKKIILLGIIFILAIITPLFFYTVPQSLANLLLLILIFTSLPLIIHQQKIATWQWLILIAIFFIHPLSAMPGLIWLGYWSLMRISNNKILKFLSLGLSAIIMPFLFVLMARLSADFGISFAGKNLINFIHSFGNTIFNYLPFYSIYHLIYLYKFNSLLLFLIFLGLGIFYLINKRHTKFVADYLLLIGALLVGTALVGLIGFTAVIGYEQAEFARRLAQILAIVSTPIVLVGLCFALEKILTLKMSRLIIIFLGGLILSFSLYLSYPHNDALEKGRSYAVSTYDLEAVKWIEAKASGVDYVVLANQSISAGSLQEFGFKKYYQNKQISLLAGEVNKKPETLFYYPIPTSSPLYEIYLDIIYNGVTLEKIEKARVITGTSKIYVVINGYWLDAQKRIEEAKNLTKQYQEIEKKVWVFEF